MQYTEEDYAQMYSELPEGLKELVLSGRLAILVSAIGSRHGLNADQVADLEPAIEDVCLGIITKDELVDNIVKNVNVDQRVANRIAAEAELEILRPFEAELIISRKQKEDLDAKISKTSGVKSQAPIMPTSKQAEPVANGPKDVSDHAPAKKVSDWYSKDEKAESNRKDGKVDAPKVMNFDWDKDFGKNSKAAPKEEPKVDAAETLATETVAPNIESKLDVLTESINKLINSRFGAGETKKDDGISSQMQELLKRLEKAEKENEENKKLIRSLQNTNKDAKPVEQIFGNMGTDSQKKIQIDKERKVEIAKPEKAQTTPQANTGNIQIGAVSKQIPIEKKEEKKEQEIVSSSVSKDTLDSIVETRNKTTPTISNNNDLANVSNKKSLTLDELIKGDSKIKESLKTPVDKSVGSLVFPGTNEEKKVDIKNMSQKDNLRQTLLDDLEFLKTSTTSTESKKEDVKPEEPSDTTPTNTPDQTPTQTSTQTDTSTSNPFKDELMPKTKEERMKALQDKIKSLNKSVSVGGKTNIAASGLDPYRL